jgi:hypothetical protein
MTIAESVSTDELLPGLQAVRDQIVADLEICASMRDRAALYARLVDVLKTIEDIRPQTSKGDVVDEIARRRAARRASAAKSAPRAKDAAK